MVSIMSEIKIFGRLRARVFDKEGNLKEDTGWSNNLVVDQGDALIADHMSATDARAMISYLEVGTSNTAPSKADTGVIAVTGIPEILDTGYPKLKGTWGLTDDNVVQYRASFEAGDLNATGIIEAALINSATHAAGDCMARGLFSTAVNVTTSDTLQVDWEITFLGA